MSAALTWIGVGLLGGCGAVLRVLLTVGVTARFAPAGRLPFGTVAVNVSGSALLGLLAGLTLSDDAMLVAGTGLLGGYTTFSTWMVDSERLAQERRSRAVAANVVGSLVAGLVALLLGRALARLLA
ncbi:fluoride efflux transporter CrcB [Conexibacter woesei]|uniref:Fluoride-specific ion channel FluC n=1 Tax=Conexibacter woesei (strain DSM 14684 / CCUG 47730 / CIP 108061 / JCM 11494 / NBRC 100937 / ID131577) TaxID=469383 RepID=D3F1Y4_CONWI|nr:fluoride efflux transporter CrcB [Conexibacter woesei]ADB54165.1 Camphor resistance CrcB protein [Conexibacter woesei DSM 14684]